MSFSNPLVEITYDGNGTDQSFGVNFHYLEGFSSTIQVELWNYTNPDAPVKESFVLGVDYTIDESGYPNTLVNTTAPVAVDYKLFIYRKSVTIQTSEFVNGAFPAESVEEGLDKVMLVSQELDAQMSRALLSPIGGPAISVEDVLAAAVLADQVNDNIIAIDDNATAISALQSYVQRLIVIISVPTVHAAATNEIIFVKAAGTTINLPAAAMGLIVKVKLDGLPVGCIINAADGIDGFGVSYSPTSSYEALSFVCDGTKWYII